MDQESAGTVFTVREPNFLNKIYRLATAAFVCFCVLLLEASLSPEINTQAQMLNARIGKIQYFNCFAILFFKSIDCS